MSRRGKQKPEPSRELERKFEGWAHRQAKDLEQGPEEMLQQAQDVLRWSIRKNGAAATTTIKAMNEVANQLSRLERVTEEVSLRENIVEGLRASVGAEDASTLNAEWKLATCLMKLGRPEEAEPLLAHVVRGRASALGDEDPQTLLAMAWSASAAKQLGRLDQARSLQERVAEGYGLRAEGESAQAQLAALNLASTLSALNELDEAARLLTHVVDVRSRTLGPDDPKTAAARQLLDEVVRAQAADVSREPGAPFRAQGDAE
jgi:tetratricopeptide (TPR) repeat protein